MAKWVIFDQDYPYRAAPGQVIDYKKGQELYLPSTIADAVIGLGKARETSGPQPAKETTPSPEKAGKSGG